MDNLMFALLTWIGSNTNYNVELALPNLLLTEPHNICANYGIQSKGQCVAAKMKGYYDKKFTIYLYNDFDSEDPVDRARLIHELVHYVQWANNKHQTTCLGHLEVEAYDLQDRWRANYNLGESIDPFRKLMFAASCDD